MIHAKKIDQRDAPLVTLTCPACGNDGTFNRIDKVSDIFITDVAYLVQRICPNPKCCCHLFIVLDESFELVASFPPQLIDFEKQNIPDKVLMAFEESINCHANQCYIAAAIMIRKTLEEICKDRKATGANLKKRIQALGSKIVLPKELLEGMDELRLLGNDAAHVESLEFDKISEEEVEVSVEFTKEILKATYQYEHLLKKLKQLKKDHTKPPTN